jgi:2-dehydro-3-deoxygluconokinase
MGGLRIACIGEAMIELSFEGAGAGAGLGHGPGDEGDAGAMARVGVAGDTLNTAIYLARCMGVGGGPEAGPEAGHESRPRSGPEVSYVTALGADDPYSARMLDFMAAEGVSTARVARLPGRLPGIYAIATDAAGERSFHYWRGASAARAMFDAADAVGARDVARAGGAVGARDVARAGAPDFSALDGADVLYLSAITLAILAPPTRAALIADLRARRAAGAKIAFDSNWRPRLWASADDAREAVAAMWSICDIALPSLDDEMALFADADEAACLARLSALIPGCGALKRGASGPAPINAPGAAGGVFAPDPAPLDTTAAGDSFNGGFLASLLADRGAGAQAGAQAAAWAGAGAARGAAVAAAMAMGHACARAVVARRGAIIARADMPPIR